MKHFVMCSNDDGMNALKLQKDMHLDPSLITELWLM